MVENQHTVIFRKNVLADLDVWEPRAKKSDGSKLGMCSHVHICRSWRTKFGLCGKEEILDNILESRGQASVIRDFVDADHASDTITRGSRAGFLIYLKCYSVY